ncbi:alanine-glyoxylate aminotransferase [Nomia melanderi]|uniref:alanine-glyoxylate aminotransferase n=1 Tax=Nomia melanderi TaxID=2448451 RepID=UPI001303F851|nr:serine--pyruvate aminotransferase, mitochondrial [Nomia melanderi]XP_031840420.1 serine--pyruvate aminotransferase, mitochondrial [Nomia melanderi]XP_031840421.1 serine--pyruvate aminotransferase, mitochondrial [Nomia melanderi]XP_031840422.1 serine--pyruvate aminotransferase, mitochondrial [Nomia melanderi]XP_031840423.1 serine--pyruvate aminotransferase, mitochondrial [Nomia melanderi]XP_031840424.1 serine--pyruvate aminotransferase, mitochondrial [Nomia melanderi]XP_031840425.1 serine--
MNREWNQLAVHMAPPRELLTELRLPVKTLTSPGPTNCSERVLRALQNQVLGHLHPEIYQLKDEIKAGLQYLFQTKNRLTLVISASGHGALEACLGNLLEPGDKILIVKCGIWGERAIDMAQRIGVSVALIETDHDKAVTLEQLESALKLHRPQAVFMVHAESSTGLKQPLEGFGDLVHKYDALLIVDVVASLGGEPFFMDSWGVDAAYTASQKVLGAPAGLSPISLSPRAEEKLFRRKTKPFSFYWDLTILGVYWKCFGNKDGVYHHTASATLLYGLREALAEIAEEGLPNTWARHAAAAVRLRKGLELRGLQCYVKNPRYQLSTVISIELPPGVSDEIIVQRAMQSYKVEISKGLGPTVGKILRIGLLGINARPEKVDLVLRALDEGLKHVTPSKI